MGRDKALLPFRGRTLLETVASAVQEAAGCVSIVGSPEKYEGLGLRVIPDLRPGCGPLAGIESALSDSAAEWVLIVACDMPGVDTIFFHSLIGQIGPEVQAVIPVAADGRIHPLAAVYHTSALPVVSAALDRGVRKVLNALEPLRINCLPVTDLSNANTPEDWAALTP
jgi:molybdopterin-guanine dinucleotide biosynthesis protein A